MAKRAGGFGEGKKHPHPHKTAKRLEAKRAMLKAKKTKKAK
ncbi:MAG: hypothetical protein WC926_02705 [Candidatus Paceibacterota bacterium]|jgi:hypothetical protein